MLHRRHVLIVPVLCSLVACGEDSVAITGSVSGLAGSGLVLTNNGTDDLAITGDGPFEFAKRVTKGQAYSIEIKTQPSSPTQGCTLDHATGKAGDGTEITVTCTTSSFVIGGTVTGLAGTGLVLQNGSDMVPISADGAFMFATPVASGATYNVVVASQPSARTQVCTVTGGSGTVTDADVTTIAVSCATNQFTIGGTVTGLAGSGLVLQDNAGDDLAISADGTFTFATPVASGDSYNVTVKTQPAMPQQSCTVASATGTVTDANVTDVAVTCTAPTWSTSLFPIAIPGPTYGLGDMTFDAAGNLLVIASSPTNAVVRVDRVTGALTTVASGIGTGYLLGIAYSAATDTIYVNTDNGIMYKIDNAGTVSLFATTNVNQLDALAIAPSTFGTYGGDIIGVSEYGTVIAVDPTTAAITTLTTTGPAMSDLVFAPDGTLYVSGSATISTMSATGVATTAFSGFSSADGITLSPDGTSMFVADSGTDQVIQVTVATAATTIIGSYNIDDGFFVGGILADSGNTVMVMTGETSLTLAAFNY